MSPSDKVLVESALAFLKAHLALLGLLDAYEQRHELPDENQIAVHLEALRKHRAGAAAFLIQYGRHATEEAKCIVTELCNTWGRCATTPWGYLDLADTRGIVQESGQEFATALYLYELQTPAKPFANPPSPSFPTEDASHSEDFRSVRWYGIEYTFTTTQAACVQVLWQAWESGTSAMSQVSILEAAGSEATRLRDIFDKGKHPAWKTMIVEARKGSFRLAKPA